MALIQKMIIRGGIKELEKYVKILEDIPAPTHSKQRRCAGKRAGLEYARSLRGMRWRTPADEVRVALAPRHSRSQVIA